jgi:hypothetical protein
VSASGCAIEGIAMSDAKVVSLVAHETRRVQAETTAELEALTKDFYAALVPLKAKGKVLQRATKGVKVPSLRKYSGGRRSKYE